MVAFYQSPPLRELPSRRRSHTLAGRGEGLGAVLTVTEVERDGGSNG
jgi:hypothetical protein